MSGITSLQTLETNKQKTKQTILGRILKKMAIVAALRTTKTQQDSLLPLDRWSSKARYDLVSTAATRRRALSLVGWLVPPLPAAPAVALVGLLHPLQHTGFHLAKTGFKGRDTNGNRRKDYTYDLLDCLTLYLYPKGSFIRIWQFRQVHLCLEINKIKLETLENIWWI